ncbi:MAG: aldehyde dehydrogenase [Chloroflexi bacterium]|nr:aldehyde dehydrogenase [Chloroflexota bacterium]OJW06549.1 MAG: glyceraldehyde-3-phosphate dehydrogenase [Chloroflexi bacterium 54-19]
MRKIAIHGFGRIGRSTLKAALETDQFVPVAISDIKDLDNLAALFAYDSNYGRYHQPVKVVDGKLHIGPHTIEYIDATKELPDWASLGVEVIIDSTGRATTRPNAEAHLARGAKKVLVSAASKSLKDCDAVLLPGINLDYYDPREHHIVSMASCTTNALAPVVKVLRENFGIQTGFFSTVHAYTNTQSLTDQPMKDRRDSWAAAENIIPSSSGAAKALKFIWPDLSITGKAYRVPTRTGSIVELNVLLNRETTPDEVKDLFRAAASTAPLQGVMDVLEGEYASSRIIGDPHSSLVDLPLVQVQNGNFLSIAAWYDNEMGYSTRLAETGHLLAEK